MSFLPRLSILDLFLPKWMPASLETAKLEFFLNTEPKQPDTKYVILADGIIEADKILMA